MKFQERRKVKKKLYSKFSLILAIIVLIILIRPTWNILQKYFATSRNLKEVSFELKELEERKTYLEAEIESLKSNLGTEREIVSKFDVVREGEEVAIILPDPNINAVKEEKKSFWQKFKDSLARFFGID